MIIIKISPRYLLSVWNGKALSRSCLGYYTDIIGRILRKYQNKTINEPLQKVDRLLRTVIDKLTVHDSGVYRVKCSCGDC